MKYFSKLIFVILLFLIFSVQLSAQKDSIKSEMNFDFGLARDWNINFWPLVKYSRTKDFKDVQVLFPLFIYHYNFLNPLKKSHLFPVYWYDSSKTEVDLKIFSTYYPSVFRYNKNFGNHTKSLRLIEIAPEINLLEFSRSPDGLFIQNNFLFLLWYKNDLVLQKSHLIFFPLYWSFKNKSDVTRTIFPFYSFGTFENNKNKYYAITPLFWHFKTLNRTKNILFPVYWSSRNENNSIKRNVIFPLFWNNKNQEYHSVTLIPLFTYGYSSDNSKKYLSITPFFWHFANRNLTRNVFFPLWWYRHNSTDSSWYISNTIFPFYWSYINSDVNNKTIFPVFWSLKNSNYHSVTFAPFFSIGKSVDCHTSHFVFTPLFWHFKNNEGVSDVLFPFLWEKKQFLYNDTTVSNVVFPLYWSFSGKEKKYKILFPVSWSFQNCLYKSFSFVPFYSSGHSADYNAGHFMLGLVYWHYKKVDGSTNILFPFWWQNTQHSAGDTTISNIIFPFYWSLKNNEINYKILFPISWSFNNINYKSFTFFPFISMGISHDRKYKHLVITPLYWHFNNSYTSNNFLIPLWWQRKSFGASDTTISSYIFPVFWLHKDKFTDNKIFFPIIWKMKNYDSESFTFAPIISTGHSFRSNDKYLIITPFYWHFNYREGYRNVLFPIWWNKNETIMNKNTRSNVIFPLYWSFKNQEEDVKVLFPILWKIKNSAYQSFTFLPIFSKGISSDGENKHLMVASLFWHSVQPDNNKYCLFPLWWHKKRFTAIDTITTNYIFPVFFAYKDRANLRIVLFPAIWYFKDNSHKSFTILPLYSAGHTVSNKRSHFMLTPLFWVTKRNDQKRVTLFPVFNYLKRSDKNQFNFLIIAYRFESSLKSKSVSFIWPLCTYQKAIDYKYFHFVPIVWYKKSSHSQYFSIQPFYYHYKDSSLSSYNILWYVFFHRNYFNIKKSGGLLWKACYWEKYENHDHEFRILYLLYANIYKEGNIEKSIFPFYYYSKEKNGNKSFNLMFYFYNSIRHQITGSQEYYEEERIFWIIRLRSNYKSLVEKGVIRDKKQLK
jgi:hypothetical protein